MKRLLIIFLFLPLIGLSHADHEMYSITIFDLLENNISFYLLISIFILQIVFAIFLFYVADEVKSNSLKRASFVWVVTMFLLVIVIVKSQIDYNQMKENGIKKQDDVGYSKIPLKEINQ